MKVGTYIWLVMLGFSAIAFAGEKERLAEQATLSWLSELDAGDYQNSWKNAASLFKEQVTQKQWKKAASGVRKPLGAVKSRERIHESYSTSLPGAPDGEYVVFQFQTEFENKSRAIETVTPMLDDGKWRVSGYFVK